VRRCRLYWQGAAIPLEESLKGRTLLFLDLFAPVLDIGLAHPHVGLYSHGLESLVFAEVKRTLVRVPDSRNADGGFFGLDVRDGIEEPVAYFTDRIPYGRWSEQRQDEIETVTEAVYRQDLTQGDDIMNRRQVLKTVLTATAGASLARSGRMLTQDTDSNVHPVDAGTIYVHPANGADSNSGAKESPENLRREAIFCSFAVVSLGASLTILASTLNLKSASVYLSRPTNIEAG